MKLTILYCLYIEKINVLLIYFFSMNKYIGKVQNNQIFVENLYLKIGGEMLKWFKKIKLSKKVILIVLIIGISSYIGIKYIDIEEVEEIKPEEEIAVVDDNKFINIIGYVLNDENGQIERNIFTVKQNDIVIDMYKNILNKIIEINDNENIKSIGEIISLNVKDSNLNQGNLKIEFENDISDFEILSEKDRGYVIEMIDKTMKEINEINEIKYYFGDKEYIPSV